MRPRTVLYFSATNEIGGSDWSLFELVRCLDRDRYRPHVVLPSEGPFTGKYQALDVPVHTMPLGKLKNTLNPVWHLRFFGRAGPTVAALWRLLDSVRPDLVHLNSSVLLLPALAVHTHRRQRSSPLIWHVRELDLRPRIIDRTIGALISHWANRIVANSSAVARRFGNGPKVQVIHNSIDLSRFVYRDRASRNGPPVLGWLGRAAPRKGLEGALDCFRRVRKRMGSARLLIVAQSTRGHEAFLQRTRDAALRSELAGDIEWRGGTDRPELALGEMDVLVHLPGVTESLGRVLIEAQAVGTPVVSWPRGGIPDTLLDGRTGRLVPVGDFDAAAEAVAEILTDRRRLADMSREASCFSRDRFSAERISSRVQNLYDEALNSRSQGPRGRVGAASPSLADPAGTSLSTQQGSGERKQGWRTRRGEREAVADAGIQSRDVVPDVSVGVIYTYERHLIESLLRSLVPASEGVRMELVLVDNASADRAEGLSGLVYPYPAKLVRNAKRLGYAPNLNRVLRAAEGRYVLLMNTDMLFDESEKCVGEMVRFMDDNPGCGVSCCRIHWFDGEFAWPARRFQTLSIILARRLRAIFGSERILDWYLYRNGDVRSAFECDWVSGCFMFLRRAAIEEVGLFDTRFIKYFEDVDICARMHDAGWQVMYNGGTSVRHLEQRASKRLFSRDARLHLWSYLRWLAKRSNLRLVPGRRAPPGL